MPRRFEKKKVSLRGNRRHGRGNIKNRRGAGNRGGRGNAGLKKHKWTYVVKYKKDYFGSRGFVRPVKKKELPVVNIRDIASMASKGQLKREGDYLVFEFRGKVLGAGKLQDAVKVKALSASEKAVKKIEEAGGTFERLEA